MTPQQLQRLFIETGQQPEDINRQTNHLPKTSAQRPPVQPFNTLAHAARALENADISSFELDFAEQAIFENRRSEESRVSKRLKIATTLGLAAMAAWFIIAPPTGEDATWRARSAAPTHLPVNPSIQAFCQKQIGDTVAFTGVTDSTTGRLKCKLHEEIKLAYTNPNPQLGFAHLAAIAEDRTINWYGPTPNQPKSLPVQKTSQPKPIGTARKLSINHKPGRYRIIGVFSERPISFQEFDKLVQSIGWEHLPDTLSQHHEHVMVTTEFEVTP